MRAGTSPRGRCAALVLAVLWVPLLAGSEDRENPHATLALIGVGDSLTHGTMDGTNNKLYTENAYLEKVAQSLRQQVVLAFGQPYYDLDKNRIRPFQVPTNLGVSGAESFTAEGLKYYKRNGAAQNLPHPSLIADQVLPFFFQDDYDKVLYPTNILAGMPTTMIDAAVWLLGRLDGWNVDRAAVIVWLGNNESSSAALARGSANPESLPVPLLEILPEIDPVLASLMIFGRLTGAVTFEPYRLETIMRNLTDLDDFAAQFEHLLDRLEAEPVTGSVDVRFFLLTLPYYSSVGYLFDSEDLEFYLGKLNPDYRVPASFARVAPRGEPIVDPGKGDRIALLTFGFMYALLSSGYSVDYVNRVLEVDSVQRDGLVLSESEREVIETRIDGFNDVIANAASTRPDAHLIDVGSLLNDGLSGDVEVVVGGKVLGRKWTRGSAFSLDGVHPGYTAQALIANFVVEGMNQALGLAAPPHDLEAVLASDPYVDFDGDGWARGPSHLAGGLTKLLVLFTDPDDADPEIQMVLPPDVWEQISQAMLQSLLSIPSIRREAARRGIR